MLSPLPRCSDGRSCLAHPFRRISLPRKGRQVGLHIVCFEACSAFTRVTACTLALSPYFVTRFTRRLQPFRYLHDCSGCFRLEHFAGWGFHPLEKRRLSTAHTHDRNDRSRNHQPRTLAPQISAATAPAETEGTQAVLTVAVAATFLASPELVTTGTGTVVPGRLPH